jgi:hypothetical protein
MSSTEGNTQPFVCHNLNVARMTGTLTLLEPVFALHRDPAPERSRLSTTLIAGEINLVVIEG